MSKVRMRVLKEFTRRLDGQIVVGHPDHPEEEGRIVNVSEGAAITLEDADLAERYSEQDQAREELEDEKRQQELIADPAKLQQAAPEKRPTTQQVRDARTDTSKTTAGRRRNGSAKAPGGKAGAQTGGNDTNATTANPVTSTAAGGGTDGTNPGATDTPDPDAAPQQ